MYTRYTVNYTDFVLGLQYHCKLYVYTYTRVHGTTVYVCQMSVQIVYFMSSTLNMNDECV